jgi:hypothetical protein
VTVLRDLTFAVSTAALPVQLALSLTSPVSCTLIELEIQPGAAFPSLNWTGRIVLNAGDTIHVATTALADVSLSGYELSLP